MHSMSASKHAGRTLFIFLFQFFIVFKIFIEISTEPPPRAPGAPGNAPEGTFGRLPASYSKNKAKMALAMEVGRILEPGTSVQVTCTSAMGTCGGHSMAQQAQHGTAGIA